MMRHPSRFLLALVFLLPGCAGFSPPDRPQDFPLHQTDHPFFDLHWRLDRGDGAVSASGLVEGTRQGDISIVYLELQGLDKDGHVVSRGLGRTLPGRLDRFGTLPFFVSLKPTGKEDRFELSVWAYDWETDKGDGRN